MISSETAATLSSHLDTVGLADTERLRLAMEAGRLGSFSLDLATGRMACSDQCKANFNLPPEADFTYDALIAMIHMEDRPRVRQAVERALRDQVDYRAEYRIVLADEAVRWISVRGKATYGEDGTPRLMIGFTQDITERERSSANLRDSEQRFRALADNIAQLAWMGGANGALFWYNQRWFDYTGTTLEQMRGWGWQHIHHPDYVKPVTEKFRAHIQSGEPWEDTFPLRGADGEFRWFLSRAFPIRNEAEEIILWCGTNTDITELRDAEAALMRAEGRVRALYALTSRTDLDFTEKTNGLLRMGREWLGLETGVLAHIDCAAKLYEIVHIDAAGDAPPAGFICPVEQTFCSELLNRGAESPPVAVENVGRTEGWRDHPSYKVFGREAYLAAVVRVNDTFWGTLAFSAITPRATPFTEFDKDMVRLMAQWFGGEIARQESEAALRVNAAQQRRFVREMLASVTEGKLCLCDHPEDLPAPLPPVSEELELVPQTLRLLRKRVATTSEDLHFPQERAQDLLTAAGEAGMNAIKHGGGGTARIHADLTKRVIQVWIQDQGTGIREEDLHRATLEKGWSGAGSLGHGFFLMLRTADRTYLLTSQEGTTVVLEQESADPQPAWLLSVS